MSKIICGHCGTANDADNKFCTSCGAPLAERETYRNGNREEEIIYTSVAPRSIALCIVLTIITFGIYGLVWMCRLNKASVTTGKPTHHTGATTSATNTPTAFLSRKKCITSHRRTAKPPMWLKASGGRCSGATT